MKAKPKPRPAPRLAVGDKAVMYAPCDGVPRGAIVIIKGRRWSYGEYTYRIRYGRTLTTCFECCLAPMPFTGERNA